MNRGIISDWFAKDSIDILEAILEPGDLLEFQRKGYKHWAVYIGKRERNGRLEMCVIHRSLPQHCQDTSSKLGLGSVSVSAWSSVAGENIGPVLVERLIDVLGDDRARINHHLDKKWTPFSTKEIVARADKLLNDHLQNKYSLLINNCEHFVNRCRYGRSYSRQVLNGVMKVSSTVGIAALTAARVGSNFFPAAGVAVAVATTVYPIVSNAVEASRKRKAVEHNS